MRFQDEPKGWQRLQTKAQSETDPERLTAIIDHMNLLLDAHFRTKLSNGTESRLKGAEPADSQNSPD
jgi:hypothetical protein